MSNPLKFKVAPHIVKDLGLNLYTTLSRVLVEYIANAYDADSPHVAITLNLEEISSARLIVKEQFTKEQATGDNAIIPLELRVLPADLQIIIEDEGAGMSRDDLDNKFLVAGRNRREDDKDAKTPKGRPVMGRKGLGKLAGFGVAKRIEVITRKAEEDFSTKIVLDYDTLISVKTTNEIEITDQKLTDGEHLPRSGTKIILSQLLYDPTKNKEDTIKKAIQENFQQITPEDFYIMFNTDDLVPLVPGFAYAWPSPEVDVNSLVKTSYVYGGKTYEYDYRIRFRKENDALPAQQRGVRVYAHNRLAAPSSLLEADTNMHGFRLTDYLDGIVNADFIDEQETDYIATDRQGLRWDSPLLAHMNVTLSEEIKKACAEYQKIRDKNAEKEVKEDKFTDGEIKKLELSKRDERLAIKIAGELRKAYTKGLSDPEYKEKLPIVLSGLGQGSLLSKITALSEQANPKFNEVAKEIVKLAADEYDQFVVYAKIRVKAIVAFKKLVKSTDFKLPENENIVQKMFEKSPWLLNPEFSQYLTANEQIGTAFHNLAKALKIGKFADPVAIKNDERPDLVFLLSNSCYRVIIVELKSTNLPLDSDHLDQLMSYMRVARSWLKENLKITPQVEGILIGTFAKEDSVAEKVLALRERIERDGPRADWHVLSFDYVLEQTQNAHDELIRIYSKFALEEDGSPSQ